ncbi:hydrolase [Nitrosopumilus sp. b3]|uniref:hydrolase n=1 Tax=Nitrosopumilus sp. b3 TaxID=2109909 RepID=UPI0015F477A0|nr:hydrolase [Nitrosopumilus sp. b3]KAF6247660.1 hydrolase [Nitrosopumilus sp. b3]
MCAIWFVFEKKDTDYFANIINDLSSKYNAHPFKPHITAYGLVNIDLDELDNIVRNSIQGEKQFIIEKSSVSYSDVFWKTLFVEFHPNKPLTRINKKLTESLDSISKYEFIPHVSLIYKKMNPDEQEKLAFSISIKNNFKVTGMWIQKFHEDIDKWRIVKKYEFIQ